MKTRNITLSTRLREVLLDGLWIANTNFKAQIQHMDWQEATHKVGDCNTIAALTFHINYYLAGLVRAFDSGRLDISDKYSFDLPPIQSASDWNALVSEFLSNAAQFADLVERMNENTFDLPFIDEKYGTILRNIEGVIEHSYYHLGQISLIKKMIKTRP